MASFVAYLASDEASFITGASVLVDGSLRLPRRVDRLRDYLDRHVRLDQERHGPNSLRMLSIVCAGEPGRWAEAEAAAAVARGAARALGRDRGGDP